MGDGGSGEKTEEPTHERLRKLREDGNVPKSQDVNMAVSFLVLSAMIALLMSMMGDELKGLLDLSIYAAFSKEENSVIVPRLLFGALRAMFITSGPILAAAMILGVSLNVAQVGFMFTTKPITPDLNKVNPINGLKGMFSMKKVVELLKTIAKFIIVSWMAWSVLKGAIRDMALIVRGDLSSAVTIVGKIIWDVVVKIGGAFLAIAAFDYFYQRKRYMKDNMMSKYDVKQEYKQSEGDPHHKAERKRVHHEIVQGGGASQVKKASVVVRNPDHIAVALAYDKEGGGTPTIVAKGQRIWAEQILAAARRYGVPIVRNVPLAQALDKLEVGDEIPEELYEAVAEILNFVYSLAEEQKKKGGKKLPEKSGPAQKPALPPKVKG